MNKRDNEIACNIDTGDHKDQSALSVAKYTTYTIPFIYLQVYTHDIVNHKWH
jgi:hypothetical protein